MFPEMCALGARLRFGIRSRGRVFFRFGWMVLSGLAGFFSQFQEILDQELNQLLSSEMDQKFGPKVGLKSWSKSWTKKLVRVSFV